VSKILEMERENFYGNRSQYSRPEDGLEILPYKNNRYFFINVGERREDKTVRKVRKVDFND
jgi:hypothetical protein